MNCSGNPIETPDIASSTEDYASRFKGETGEWLLKVQERGTLAMLKGLEQGTVLDVGGGHAQNLPCLSERGYPVTVFGSTQECSQRIRKYIDNGKAAFVTGNLVALPFRDRQFDIVISYRMVTHLIGWKKFLSELCRVSDRSVIIDFPSIRSVNVLSDAMFLLKKKIEKNTRTYTIFSEREIVQEFQKNGFSKKDKVPQFFMPMVFHRALKSRKLSEFSERLIKGTGLTGWFGSPVIIRFDRVT